MNSSLTRRQAWVSRRASKISQCRPLAPAVASGSSCNGHTRLAWNRRTRPTSLNSAGDAMKFPSLLVCRIRDRTSVAALPSRRTLRNRQSASRLAGQYNAGRWMWRVWSDFPLVAASMAQTMIRGISCTRGKPCRAHRRRHRCRLRRHRHQSALCAEGNLQRPPSDPGHPGQHPRCPVAGLLGDHGAGHAQVRADHHARRQPRRRRLAGPALADYRESQKSAPDLGHLAARHLRRRAVLRRQHDHPGDLGALGGRGTADSSRPNSAPT